MRAHILATLILGSLASTTLSAQDAPPADSAAPAPKPLKKGFWIGFGLGGGINLSEGLDDEQLWGGAGYLRMGGTTSQKVLLGGEAIGWVASKGNTDLARGNVHFVAMWYPTNSPLYLKGGIGVASISRESHSGNTTTTTDKGGFGVGIGTGYELKIGKNLYLVPSVDLLGQFFSEENDPVLGDIPGHNTLLLFTLGLLWH